ncbi:MAG TPA: SRPBCC family protein [Mycobacterium sp.]|nr:SRPBCC family protein [Mycobacterium sp.]
MHSCATTVVPVPVAKVWEVLADHEGMASWAPGMKASVVRGGDFEHNGVGAVRRIQALPLLPPFVEEITFFEPDERLTYKAVSGIPLRNYVGDVVLRPLGDNTEIVYTISADNQIPGVAKAIAGALLFLFKRAVNRAHHAG